MTDSNLARFRKFFKKTNGPALPDPSPACIAATLLMGRLDNELCAQFAARGIDLCDESQVSDEEYSRLIESLEHQAGLDKFDEPQRIAAEMWVLDHPDSESESAA